MADEKSTGGKSTLRKVKDNGIEVLALTLGIAAGVFTMKLAKGTGKLPYWAEPAVGLVPGLGLAVGVTGDTTGMKFLRSAGKGIAAVGMIDLAEKATTKISFLAPGNQYVPKVAGLGEAPMLPASQDPSFLSGGMRGLGEAGQPLFLS